MERIIAAAANVDITHAAQIYFYTSTLAIIVLVFIFIFTSWKKYKSEKENEKPPCETSVGTVNVAPTSTPIIPHTYNVYLKAAQTNEIIKAYTNIEKPEIQGDWLIVRYKESPTDGITWYSFMQSPKLKEDWFYMKDKDIKIELVQF